jgi:hypothetical protein
MSTDKSCWCWLWAALCIAFAGLMLLCGWLVPMHLRAVDASVLQRAGENGSSLADRGVALERANNADAARLILQAAQDEKIRWTGELASSLATHADTELLFPGGPMVTHSTPATTAVIKLENRDRVLAYLEATGSPAVRELLRTRDLTNTALFPPSSSPSGQAFDAAVSVCGLLMADNHLAPGLAQAVVERAATARTRASAQPLEEILMDLISLGQRLDWGELKAFVNDVDDPRTLALLTTQARNAGTHLPTLFAAVTLSQKPAEVVAYLNEFSKTGLTDLGASLHFGEGGLDELLLRHQRLYTPPPRPQWTASGPIALFMRAASDYALRAAWFALMVKWFFYISGGFLLAAAGHFAWPGLTEIEEPLRVRGIHMARELLFAVGFLLVVLLLSEPFLAQDSQKAELAFRLRLPMTAVAATASKVPLAKASLMDTFNSRNLITLLLFFVLQGLIYCACLVKLAEIRRQKVPARVQLRLLENEEHLFDAGLYLGFAGTIVCLILVSLGSIKFSLMAAYSSTSFGIIFVSIFKIFNLRPARRQLLMQSEAQSAAPAAPVAPVSATPSLMPTA